jgi:hypothetical protein
MSKRFAEIFINVYIYRSMQKQWKAVDKLELHHLVDVVILSTKGPRRAADFLSGGSIVTLFGSFIPLTSD